LFEAVFAQGKSFSAGIFRIQFLILPHEGISDISPEIQVGVSVPKKKHKKAVTRNLLKRRMREAYRQYFRQYLPGNLSKSFKLYLVLVYIPTTIEPYSTIESDIKIALKTLQEKLCSVL
jgi:ribonuclease P protein component